MSRQRDIIAGGTDYTGVGIEDMLEHLNLWCLNTSDVIEKLNDFKIEVNEKSNLLDHPKEILVYINYFQDLFERYLSDLQRVKKEIVNGVRKSHIETMDQIYRSSKLEDTYCVNFKRDNIQVSLNNENMRPLLDYIYATTRDQIIDYKDLSNVVQRLKALVDNTPIIAQKGDDIVDIKPNFFGLGINFNAILKKFRRTKKKI